MTNGSTSRLQGEGTLRSESGTGRGRPFQVVLEKPQRNRPRLLAGRFSKSTSKRSPSQGPLQGRVWMRMGPSEPVQVVGLGQMAGNDAVEAG